MSAPDAGDTFDARTLVPGPWRCGAARDAPVFSGCRRHKPIVGPGCRSQASRTASTVIQHGEAGRTNDGHLPSPKRSHLALRRQAEKDRDGASRNVGSGTARSAKKPSPPPACAKPKWLRFGRQVASFVRPLLRVESLACLSNIARSRNARCRDPSPPDPVGRGPSHLFGCGHDTGVISGHVIRKLARMGSRRGRP